MDGIGSTADRTTDELLRRAAEDAGQQPEEHYRALGATYEQKKASFESDRTDAAAAWKLGKLVATKGVPEVSKTLNLTKRIEAAADLASATLRSSAPFLRAAAAGNAIAHTITIAYELMDKGFVRPGAQGDALRSALNNDAMMVGLSHVLTLPDGFKAAMARMRPEVAAQGGAAIAAQFAGKDKEMLPVLQQRADDGLVAARPWAERMAGAKTDADRMAVMKEFEKSNVAKHAGNDAAYGVGVAGALWAVGAKARGELPQAPYEQLFKSAEARLDAGRPMTAIHG